VRRDKPDLPTGDVPSAEVLDELLRAFAADATDAQARERIDLTSPEVAELIAGPSPATGNPRPQPDVDVEAPPDAPPAEPPAPGDTAADVPADVPADLPAEQSTDEPAAEQPTEEPAEPADEPTEAPADEEPAEPADEPTPADAAPPSTTIVIDASDDPPDAVYLAAGDPLLAASAAGRDAAAAAATGDAAPTRDGPVFIDDAAVAVGETISVADASTATKIEPRLRERRIAVKRAAGRKRLRWVLVAVGVLVVIVAVLAVLGSSLFAIDEVRVDGAVYTDEAALDAVIDDLEGTPVLRADTDSAEERLEAIPWVASARVTTRFPNRATIELRERTPVATYEGPDGRFRVIDVDGRVLDVLDGEPTGYLLVTSPDAPDLDAGRFAPRGFVAAANLVQALTPELRAMAESVVVTADATDLRMLLSEGREVRFGPGRDLVAKLVRLQTRLDQVDAGGFQYLDVSTDEVTTG
jgi:cell division protein FtsQ